MPATRATTHIVDPVYATPVLRESSPAESINTDYGQDTSSISAAEEGDDEEFARKVEEQIGLRKTTWAEAGAAKPIILPRPTNDSKEEQMLFERVMKNLREKVKELEDEEMYDSALQLHPGPAFVPPDPSSNDVESIIRSMLPCSISSSTTSQRNASGFAFTISHGPSYPSTFTARGPSANGDSSGMTFTGRRYGNLGRNQ